MSDSTDAAVKGMPGTSEEFLPAVYEDLRRLAAHRLASLAPGQTLQPTALVHEAWLRLARGKDQVWESRVHFFATAAQVMRRVVVDHLRSKARLKNGGGQARLDIDRFEIAESTSGEKVLLIDEALEEFDRVHPDKARVVLLKFFGGLTNQDVAVELGVTERTVERHWAFAKAWLYRSIQGRS